MNGWGFLIWTILCVWMGYLYGKAVYTEKYESQGYYKKPQERKKTYTKEQKKLKELKKNKVISIKSYKKTKK